MYQLYKPTNMYETLGIFTNICYNDKTIYRHINITDMARIFLPPIRLGQFAIWITEKKEPFAFMTWALLDDKREKLLLDDSYIKPVAEDWQSGQKLWLMDFVSPYGNVAPLLYQAREILFSEHKICYAVRRNVDGSIKKIKRYPIPRPKENASL